MRRTILLVMTLFVGAGALAIPGRDASADDASKKLFNAQCATCHGVDGRGQTTAGRKVGVKDWTTGTTLKSLSDAEMEKMIREGRKDKSGKETMPPLKNATNEQVKGLIAYVRTFQK